MKDLVLGKYILFLILPGLILLGWQAKLIPYTEPVSASVSISPTPTPTSENMGQAILDENEEGLEKEKTFDIQLADLEIKNVDSEILKAVDKYFGDNAYTALRVAHCESRLDQSKIHTNTDGSLDVGLFQINQKWHERRGNAYDLDENVRIAKEIYDEQGWNPWVCYWRFSEGWGL